MDIVTSTAQYEAWLARHIRLLPADIEARHRKMAESAFAFMRATYYRWVQLWPLRCSDMSAAPTVLSVGDLHVENLGTWRDTEGRLAWGVNDFDEACPLPYTNDLVRLAASALLAIQESVLAVDARSACAALLDGYGNGLSKDGYPFVLAEQNTELREVAIGQLEDPVHFWQKLDGLRSVDEAIPPNVADLLARALPESRLPYRVVHRQAGLGSLGRRRYTAIADWRGGKIAREAKELAPPASGWEQGDRQPTAIYYPAILQQAVRIPDPSVFVRGSWVVRRLAPDCIRIELSNLPKQRDEEKLLAAMGFETANIHLGSRKAIDAVRSDLNQRPGHWLQAAAQAMSDAINQDWREWRTLYGNGKVR